MVLAPHPDDEILAAGGLMHAAREVGAALRVCYLTYGENNPWAQLVGEARWPFRASDRAAWGLRRRFEALAALACLSVPESCATFLGFPDQGLTDLLLAGDDAPARAIEDTIREWRPTMLVVPSLTDAHPDHSAASVLTTMALARVAPRERPRRILRYRVHGRAMRSGEALSLMLDRSGQEKKRAAVLCHRSQLAWHRREYLDCIGQSESFEEDGERHRAPYGSPDGSTLALAHNTGKGGGPWRGSLRILLETWPGERKSIAIDRSMRAWSEDDLAELALGVGQSAVDPLRWCFVVLDQRAKRRLGFLDSTRWLEASLPEPESALRPPARVLTDLSACLER
jgi:LmbE family N-acetylglucosaminyl deacetylase